MKGLSGVSVAALNSPFSVTFSGEAVPLDEINRQVDRFNFASRFDHYVSQVALQNFFDPLDRVYFGVVNRVRCAIMFG